MSVLEKAIISNNETIRKQKWPLFSCILVFLFMYCIILVLFCSFLLFSVCLFFVLDFTLCMLGMTRFFCLLMFMVCVCNAIQHFFT